MYIISLIKLKLKKIILAKKRKSIGSISSTSKLGISCNLCYPNNIFIHDYVSIGPNSYINAKGKVIIRDGVIIGPYCRIITSNHNYNKKIKSIPYDNIDFIGDVVINEGVWIADSVMILPGVTIGKGAIVGAGSVVSKDVPDYAIVAGNPAKIIKYRDKEEFDNLLKQKKFVLAQNFKNKIQIPYTER